MSENEDKCHDTVIDLEAKAKKNEDVVLKMDFEDILDDATKSQITMKRKSQDPIAIERKQNVWTIDYKKLNALYEDFVPQKEFSAEQNYFSSSFISFENSSNASLQYSSSETKPTMTPMPSLNPMLVDLNKMENVFKTLFELLQTNSKRESIFYTSLEEIRLTNFCQQEVKPVLHELHLHFEIFQKQFLRDIKEMKDVFDSTENDLKKVEVSDRTNKKSDVASKNVDSNKKIVTNDDIKNALIAKNVLCVSSAKNVLILCHDNCLAKYKLNVHSKVRRALFTTSRIVKSKFKDPTPVVSKTRFYVKTVQSKSLDTTPVVSKTKIVVVTPLSTKHKVSSAFTVQDSSLGNYMKNKIQTSQMWQKWYESQPNVGWSPVKMPSNVNCRPTVKTSVGCSKHMTGDRSLLKISVEKFTGTVRFGNDHSTAITDYGDYVQGNITVCHVYYVQGLGHNLFSVGQFCGGDLEVAFRSKTCYVRNLKGDDLLTRDRKSNLYTISIFDMAASSPVCLMSKATSTKSWL
ncbi:hypothetical protein Tco_1504199 [Tanacetum coccineum]